MIAMTDVAKINRLNQERARITQATKMLDHGWRVSAVGIAPPEQAGAPGRPPFTVPVDDASELTEDVKQLLADRLQRIESELAGLGIEPEPEPEPPPPEPEPAPRPQPRQPAPARRRSR